MERGLRPAGPCDELCNFNRAKAETEAPQQMYRNLQYAWLFLAAVLLQTFLFDNLSLSVYLNPLVYVVFIALLPMETPPLTMLLCGLATGAAMDWTMGAAGVNTIATVFVAFVRIHLLNFVCGKENVHDGGIPSSQRLGGRSFPLYLGLVVVLHNAIFFYMEALSWSHALSTLLRLCVSAAVGLVFCWLIAQVFTPRLSLKI